MPTRIVWDDPETNLLVSERRRRNDEYYRRYRGIKFSFGKVSHEEYIGDTIEDILLANASRNGEI